MSVTREEWARIFLAKIDRPITAANVLAVVTWASAENSQAACNPLDTTEPWPGSTDYNEVGVKNYASLDDGINATAATIGLGYYTTVMAALADGASAANVCDAVARSAWGTHNCAELLPAVSADFAAYAGVVVAGTAADNPPDPEPPAPTPAPEPEPAPTPEPTPAPGEVTVNVPELQQGSSGEAVASVQVLVNARAKLGLVVDGAFGPLTEAGVRMFQAQSKIAVDGIVGPVTWGALLLGS